jgi:hypothetical protein
MGRWEMSERENGAVREKGVTGFTRPHTGSFFTLSPML